MQITVTYTIPELSERELFEIGAILSSYDGIQEVNYLPDSKLKITGKSLKYIYDNLCELVFKKIKPLIQQEF